jgi:RimJ/RimL family protein N-acetyltransferase
MTLEVADAIVHGLRPADPDEWAPDYPTEATLVAASMVVAAAAEGREEELWGSYQVVRRDTGRVIGGGGFGRTPPDARGEVHVGYSIAPSERGAGFAAEAVRGLVAWALGRPGVARVLAETARTNEEGLRTYEAAGMRRRAGGGDVVVLEA